MVLDAITNTDGIQCEEEGQEEVGGVSPRHLNFQPIARSFRIYEPSYSATSHTAQPTLRCSSSSTKTQHNTPLHSLHDSPWQQ